jgi:hypothetical protein
LRCCQKSTSVSFFTLGVAQIAQLLTVKREQEIAAGTNLRQARKVEK